MWKSFSDAIKQDLATFVTTIQEDTTKTLTKVVGLEDDDPKDEELTLREKLIADTKRSFSTYGTPVEEMHEVQYERFFRAFSLASHGKDIAELLDSEIDVSRYYAELVPAQISAEDFWARYFFRLALVSKGGVLSLNEDDDEEELVWESEERQEEVSAAAAAAAAAGAVAGAGAVADGGISKSGRPVAASSSSGHDGIGGGVGPQASSESRVLRAKVGTLEDENQRLRGQVKTLAGRVAELERLLLGGVHSKSGPGGVASICVAGGAKDAPLASAPPAVSSSGSVPPAPTSPGAVNVGVRAAMGVSSPSTAAASPPPASNGGSNGGSNGVGPAAAPALAPATSPRPPLPPTISPSSVSTAAAAGPGPSPSPVPTHAPSAIASLGTIKQRATITFPTRVATISGSTPPMDAGDASNYFVSVSTPQRAPHGGGDGRGSSFSSTATTTLHGTRISGATSAATGESNHGSVSPLTEVTEANTKRNKRDQFHAASARLAAEAVVAGGGPGNSSSNTLLRRISDNVSECTSEQEQSHSAFFLSNSGTETSFSSSMEVQRGGGGSRGGSTAVSFADEDSDGSGVLVAAVEGGTGVGKDGGKDGGREGKAAAKGAAGAAGAVAGGVARGAGGKSGASMRPSLAALDDDEEEDGWG